MALLADRAFKDCNMCGGPFRPVVPRQIHCSGYCRDLRKARNQQARMKLRRLRCTKCARASCRKVFWTRHSRRAFCSDNCRQVAAHKVQRECRRAEARIAAREAG